METIFEKLEEWLRGLLVPPILQNLQNIFDSMNGKVGEIGAQVATTPANFEPGIFGMIRNISDTVIMPIAGLILTYIACYELIQLIIAHNNLANFETWIFFKWVFKTAIGVLLISNCWNITNAVFDVAGTVISRSSGLISGGTAVSAYDMGTLTGIVENMEIGELFMLFMQTVILQVLIQIMAVLIQVIVYSRMIEIYLSISLAPIPIATLSSREQGMMGQNYLRSLFALGFQGFLIMICVGIYAVLIQGISLTDDIVMGLWNVLGYSVLLGLTLFKTGSIAKSILHAH